MARLGDYIKQIRGVSYKPEDLHSSLDDNSISLLRANNIQDGKLVLDDVVFVDKSKVRAEQLLKQGDILICTSSGSKELVGKAAFVESDMNVTFGAFCKVVRPVMEHPRYLGHYFNSAVYRKQISALSAGANINNIRGEHIDSLEIQIPSINEQVSRSNSLSKIDELISLRKKQLQKLDDLVKSRFVEMFGDPETNPKGWKKESLKEHAEVIVGYPFPSEGYTETGISIVGGYNLMQGFIQWEDSKHWPNEQGYKQYLLQSNDIVMAMDRPWVNGGFKIAKVEAKYLPALLIQRTACIRGRDLEQEFLYSLLNTQRFAEHCNITGSLVPHISNKDINSFKVIIPPEKVQKQFSAFASQADESKQTIQQGLDKLEQMKQALMQKYFGC